MMNRQFAFAVIAIFVASDAFAAPDWSKVAPIKMTLFFPGQASLEWVMNERDHSAALDIVNRGRSCAKCHRGDANETGDKIVKGQAVGSSKSVLEPKPMAGKAGSIPVQFRATHDGNNIYFRVEWVSPQGGSDKMDANNEVKLTMMFDGGGTVDGANQNGCWATCHNDLRSMKNATDDKKTKHIKGADLGKGVFMDLIQFRSGKGEKPLDGYVADQRVMEGGKGLISAEGKKEGNKWIVTFERQLAGGGSGDHVIAAGKNYNFGIAIHEDYASARYHYVSLGYQFALDEQGPEKSQINVVKQ